MPNLSYSALTQRLLFISLIILLIFSVQTTWAEELAAPEFSHESGFYPEEFDLKITHPDRGVKIYYTLDGSDPDPENLKGSTYQYKNEYAHPPNKPSGELLENTYQTHLYRKAIRIKDRTYEPDRLSQISTTFDEKPSYFPKPEKILKDSFKNKVKAAINKLTTKSNGLLNKLARHIKKYILNKDNVKTGKREYLPLLKLDYEYKYLYKGTAVKAIAIDKKNSISRTITKTLFIGDQSDFSLPIVNITVPEKDLFDYKSGGLVAGKTYENWLNKGDFGSIEKEPWGWPANWRTKNRIPANLTIIDHERNKLSESYVELRVHGNASRRFALKSLRLYPDKNRSVQGIQLDLFRDGNEIGLDRINLRNGGSHWASNYPTDAAIHKMMIGLDLATQRYQPVSTYINGEYYGLLNARDRKDHYYISSLYNLPNKNIDLLKQKNIAQRGSSKSWIDLLNQLEKHQDKNDINYYNKVNSHISISSFIDYYIAEIFIANADWPNNNISYWRYKGTDKHPITEDGYTDGRWRWFMYDTDAAGQWANLPDLDMLSYATAIGSKGRNPDWSTLPLRILLENEEIKEQFITRFTDLLNTHFMVDRTVSILKSVRENVIDEMPKHIERWNQRPANLKTWEAHIKKLTNLFEKRPKYQWQHLQDFFELDGLYSVQVDIAQQDTGKIKVNTLIIGDDPSQKYDVTDTPLFFPWSGQYFQNMPLTLKALPEAGYVFSHWEVFGQKLTEEQKQSQKLILKPQGNLQIKAIMVKMPKLPSEDKKIISSDFFDVYLDNNVLTYSAINCSSKAKNTRFFLHLHANNENDLPKNRKQSGFDNLDFSFNQGGKQAGKKCRIQRELPKYKIKQIATGQFNQEEGRIWQGVYKTN